MEETCRVILLHNLYFIFLPFFPLPLWGAESYLRDVSCPSPGLIPEEDERAIEMEQLRLGKKVRKRL